MIFIRRIEQLRVPVLLLAVALPLRVSCGLAPTERLRETMTAVTVEQTGEVRQLLQITNADALSHDPNSRIVAAEKAAAEAEAASKAYVNLPPLSSVSNRAAYAANLKQHNDAKSFAEEKAQVARKVIMRDTVDVLTVLCCTIVPSVCK